MWDPLDGRLTTGPAATSWAAGRIDVFAGDWPATQLAHKWFENGWHPWDAPGGAIASAPTAVSGVALGGNTNIKVFARDGNQALQEKDFRLDTGWQSWQSLGGQLTSGPGAATLDP
jgi:hypothetical protein